VLRNTIHAAPGVDMQASAAAACPVGHEPIRSCQTLSRYGFRLLALMMGCFLGAACSKASHGGSSTASLGGSAGGGAGGSTASSFASGGQAGGSVGGHAGASNTAGSVTGGSGGQDTGGSTSGGGGTAGGGGDAGGNVTRGGAGGGGLGGGVGGGSTAGGGAGGFATGGAGAGSGGAAGNGTGGAGAAGADAAIAPDAAPPTDTARSNTFLHVEGARLVDGNGKTVRLTGVNWFGLETNNQEPHGIWSRDYHSMVKQIAALGFNAIRLPWSNEILRSGAQATDAPSFGKSGPDGYDGTNPINADLVGKSPLEIMDKVIAAAGEFGVKMILDNHSRDPDGYMNEEVWYTASTSEQQWINDWVSLATRYKGNPTVVGFDLDNEPHGKATWGAGVKDTDWNSAAERCGNAILAANPDVLIVVEGVSIVGTDTYWWGGNLSAVRTVPINLSKPEKLVYSAHEYGPEVHDQTWFDDATFPNNLSKVWDQHFSFIMSQGIGHILLGEFGIKDRSASSGKSGQWFDTLLKQLGSTYSWTFWCWNPNSGDTEGILQYDWLTPQQWKMDALKPYMAPFIGR